MKKTLSTIAIAAITLFASSSAFAAPRDKKECRRQAQTEQCCKKESCADSTKCKQRPCPFEGLNLTESQQQQLKAICPKARMADGKAKCDLKDAKCDGSKKPRQCKKQYLDDVKKILTPEQYVQFLENSFLKGGAKGMKPGKCGRR